MPDDDQLGQAAGCGVQGDPGTGHSLAPHEAPASPSPTRKRRRRPLENSGTSDRFRTQHREVAALDAPVTVTFVGRAAEELRRVTRRGGGPARDATIATVARIALLRGLVIVDRELDATVFAHNYRPAPEAP